MPKYRNYKSNFISQILICFHHFGEAVKTGQLHLWRQRSQAVSHTSHWTYHTLGPAKQVTCSWKSPQSTCSWKSPQGCAVYMTEGLECCIPNLPGSSPFLYAPTLSAKGDRQGDNPEQMNKGKEQGLLTCFMNTKWAFPRAAVDKESPALPNFACSHYAPSGVL